MHDGFIGTFAKTYKKDYARIRFLGAIAYFSATLVAALLLKISNNNYNILLAISGCIFILLSLFFIWIKPIDLSITKEGKEVKRDYKAILKNKTFIIYMIVYFLVNTVSFAADSFVGLYFTDYHNMSSSRWSLIFASFLLMEFLTMLILSRRSDKINVNIVWVIVTILYPLRSMIFALDLPLPISVVAASFRGVSYGLMLMVNVKCIEKICGIENVTAALFIMAIFTAIIQAVSSFVFGGVIEDVGYQFFFAIVSICGFIGMVVNLVYQIKHNFKYE